jgi:DNA repair exonuclease SbcCD ATPase subunit
VSTAAKWRLDTITVRSFRGIDRELTFELGGKPALFWGNNGVGKSTIALALQWTLFGRFPDGVLANRGFKQFLPPVATKSGTPCCYVSFRRGSERLIVHRDEEDQVFSVRLGSETWEDEEAELQRDAILGIDMDAFVRAVLLHQTRTRGLLLDDAKSRNHAIDMLLGVEVAQNLYAILKPKPFLDAAEECRTEIEDERREYAAQNRILERQLEEAVKSGREAGFAQKDFKWDALFARYKTLALDIVQLATNQEVAVPELHAPDDLKDARVFSAKATKALNQIQAKAALQNRLASERALTAHLETLRERWVDAIALRESDAAAFSSAENEHGNSEKLALERDQLRKSRSQAREELKGLNELYRLLADAHSYIEEHNSGSCPVCEEPADGAQLTKALARRLQAVKSREISAKENDIKTIEAKLKSCENAETELLRLRRQLESAQKDVDGLILRIKATLSLETLPEGKVQPRLSAAISKSESDCRRLEEQTEALLGQIEGLNSQLTALSLGVLPVLEKRVELLAHENEAKQAPKKHAKAEKRADELESIGTHLERIQKALLSAKERLASDRLNYAKPRALSIYKQLVRHTRFNAFEIATTPMSRKVDYNFVVSVAGKSGTEREARLVLSDGQITATAIGIFIGLAESAGHALDFLFIDDPTQNVDEPCKEAMAKLMTEIAEKKQVVISTHDDAFVTCLEEQGFHRRAAVFALEKWDGNPTVTSSLAARK